MIVDPKDRAKDIRCRRIPWLVVAAAALAVVILAGVWLLPGVCPQRSLPSPTFAPPTATLVPTFTPLAPPTPSPTRGATATPRPAVAHPTITGMEAQVDDVAGSITFRLQAQVPPDREVAEALLWYDTQTGRRVQRIAGPLPPKVELSYQLDVAQEGLTRTLTTTDELDYWWLVRDTSGETVRAGATTRLGPALLERVTAATPEAPAPDFTWVVSETRHFQFHYAPGTAAERDRFQLGAVAEAVLVRLQRTLQLDLEGQMAIYLIPRVFWQGAATYDNKVQLISYLDRNYTGIETWSYFAHEGTHALAQDLLQQKEGGPDGVLVEGLAVWATSGHYGLEPIDAWASVVAASDEYLPLDKLRAGPFYEFQHETSYLEAGSFVKFLADRYGLDRLKELYGLATGKPEQDEELVQRLYGKGYADLEADWLAYLRELSPAQEEAEAWHLQVRSFDLMRRYETQLDPDARILPDKSPSEWMSDTLKIFLRRREEPVNLALETALIAVQERIRDRAFDAAAALLDDIEAALDAGGTPMRPSLEARQAILGLVAEQDRAVLLADVRAYLSTFEPDYVPPATLETWLQQPITDYRQEVVRLDVAEDGRAAQGVVLVHARLLDDKSDEDGQLFAVTFVYEDGRWWMVGREPVESILELPPDEWYG